MITPYTRAPHQGGAGSVVGDAPHAALLIDFDNVTMGMRSDLSKELKSLLASDVIKGKVSVQRAYADWRRYPQYIVPLSEASVDLIFAPAYGSNKKNATDIRMAIDAVELVFTRPEIGTFILLTGDSDFSSLVLKLKEYGKYVVGVGIQESSSDILVQNCDEYYSYTSLTGLRKTTDIDRKPQDAWVLVTQALKRMTERDDVMRSDRLKQVMQEIDSNFDEGALGFSKFSKFLTEASSRGLVGLKKLDNGQYEVAPPHGGGRTRKSDSGDERGGRRDRGGRGRRDRQDRDSTSGKRPSTEVVESEPQAAKASRGSGDPLRDAYDLLSRSLEELRDGGRPEVRDSDVKRKMLDLEPSFDEAELGFSKFTKFLIQAGEHDVVDLRRNDAGNYEVSLPGAAQGETERQRAEEPAESPPSEVAAPTEQHANVPTGQRAKEPREPDAKEAAEPASSGPKVVEIEPEDLAASGRRLGPRRGSTRRRGEEEGPSLFAGQMVPAHDQTPPSSGNGDARSDDGRSPETSADVDLSTLGLPSDPDAMVRYLAHRYRGVGEKTAEALVERFGTDLFATLRDNPKAVTDAVTPKRAEQVLEAWKADYERRVSRAKGRQN